MNTSLIREKRLRKGLSQVKLAEKVGTSTLTIINIEKGTANPNLKTMQEISRTLESSLEELFGG